MNRRLSATEEPAPPITLADLRPAPYNPRSITPETIEALKRSLGQFGDLGSITWNRRTGNLVGGHQRMEALRQEHGNNLQLKMLDSSLAVVVTPAGDTHYVRVVDWDEAKEKAANLAANNPHLQGDWDDEKLSAMLEELKGWDAQIFKDVRFTELEKDLRHTTMRKGKTDPNEVPDVPKKPISKLGDLWLLGNHRLLCGDSTKPEDVGRLMGEERAVLMATDPPYGVALDAKIKVDAANESDGGNRMPKWDEIENDGLQGAELQGFLERVFHAACEHALDVHAAWYLWHAHLTQGFFAAAAAAAAANLVLHRQIIWAKEHLLFGRGDYHWKHELCFYGWQKGNRPPFYGPRNQTTVWSITNETSVGKRVHPTQKPVEIFAIPMRNHTKKGGVCFEPFSGSGSQFIAAEQLDRRCFGLELSPAYCDVIKTRWENFTGKKATLERNG